MENEPKNCPECGWLNGQCDCDVEPLVGSIALVVRDGAKPQINPEWRKATHLILWMYPGAPSFEEQIALDKE